MSFFRSKAFDKATGALKQFPKGCSCGRKYTVLAWHHAPYVGQMDLPWGEVLELRNCTCGSTLSVQLVEGEPEGLTM